MSCPNNKMASNDWFAQSSSASASQHAGAASFATPQRRNLRSSAFGNQQGHDDDLDPDDARLAAGITYLPSFGSTPQGRAAMAQSPGGMQAGFSSLTGPAASSPSTSYSQPRRSSPTQRFAPGGLYSSGDSTSPRASPRGRVNVQAAVLPQDEEAPPTATLEESLDNPVPSRSSNSRLLAQTSMSSPTSGALQPGSTSLHVYGPPPHLLPNLRSYLEQCGTVVSLVPGPEQSNWITVTYSAEWEAALLLRRNGDIVGGKWLLGVKLGGPGSLAGCSLGGASARRETDSTALSQTTSAPAFAAGVGTPLRLVEAKASSIFKNRTEVTSDAVRTADAAEYDWDDKAGGLGGASSQSGFLGRVGELVVSTAYLRPLIPGITCW